jgi:VanZ family protein
MALIFALSSIPQADLPEAPIPNIDKIAHLIEYAILGALFIRAFRRSQLKAALKNLVVITILLSAAYAATDEIHQHFVPGRKMDIGDWIFDCLGSSLGILYRLGIPSGNCPPQQD